MKKMLTNNLGLKLLSIIAAIMLWLVVVSIDDPVIYLDFSGIRVTMLNEDAVTSKDKVYKIEDDSDIISIRVRVKRSVADDLSPSDFTATADMEKNIKYDNLVGIDVTCSNRNVSSADITKSRENVVISVEDASSEQFNVVVKQTGQEGSGYVVGTAVPEQSLIQISGPASVVARIDRVEAELDVTGFTSDRTKLCQLSLLGSDKQPLPAADLEYLEYYGKTEGMKVNVTMLKTKTVPLKVGYIGEPAEDCSFKSISCWPETLEIAGTSEAISGIRTLVIPDERVNIDGITEELQLTIDITEDLPAGIRLANSADATVTVVVEVEKKQGRIVQIPVSELELLNVPKGMKTDFGDLESIEVVVMGTSADLSDLDESKVKASLDLDDCTKAGTYTRKADVTLPERYNLMQDVEVEFKLIRAAAANKGSTASQ